MRKMHIDFAPPGWRRALYRLHPGVVAGSLLGLALCAGAALNGWQMVELQRAREAQVNEALQQQRRQSAQASGAQQAARVQIPEAQGKAVNAAVLLLNLPWRDMQAAVATATQPTVALLALEPDPHKQVLKISAEAKSADDMIAYIEQLKQQEFFSGAVLARHEINDQDPNRPIRFQVEAQWGAR